jgi:hypothetical protein
VAAGLRRSSPPLPSTRLLTNAVPTRLLATCALPVGADEP